MRKVTKEKGEKRKTRELCRGKKKKNRIEKETNWKG